MEYLEEQLSSGIGTFSRRLPYQQAKGQPDTVFYFLYRQKSYEGLI
jgi:hypothetical protein